MWNYRSSGRLAAGIAIIVAGLGIAAYALHSRSGGSHAEMAALAAEPQIPQMLVMATDNRFDAPAHVEAGPVALTLVNNGQQEHEAIVVRLNDDVTEEQFTAALAGGPPAVLPLSTFFGGPKGTPAGTNARVIVDLTPGRYVLLCAVEDPDGVSHTAKGMIQPFEASPSLAGTVAQVPPAPAPAADVKVTAREFAFDAPAEIAAGRQTWEFANAGGQPHHLRLLGLAPGKTFDDLAAYAQHPVGPAPIVPVGGLEVLTTGNRSWADFDLRPGGYALACFIPDPATGKEHVDLGMLKTFTVRGD